MKEAIIIFTRVPIAGKTKTRLEKMITKEECADIHKCFLKDIKKICLDLDRDVFVFYTPEDNNNTLRNIFGRSVEFIKQQGIGLGEKMSNAIEYVLRKKYSSCILVGSDIPFFKQEDLEMAFNILGDKDIVLGPTYDKGYYLVGMKQPIKVIFEDIEYGCGNVLDNTIKSIYRNNLTYGLTTTNRDIDEPDDLYYFYRKIMNKELSTEMNTSKFIIDIMKEYSENVQN